jgi:hypothetical protein
MKTALVVTTIQGPNDVMRALSKGANNTGWSFIVIGDKKGPKSFDLEGVNFLDLNKQMNLSFSYAKKCPVGHYSRKNIGYLVAMMDGADVIVETDDDNFPLPAFFNERSEFISANTYLESGWLNVYRSFSDEKIWPRGFPLRYVHSSKPLIHDEIKINAPIQQGLADENPDVDAIYRLLFDLPKSFKKDIKVVLQKDQFCPFNSQNTAHFKSVFPLLYLPSYCSFRMTDIWRSFVSLRILHSKNLGTLFHSSTVYQVRNDHDLMKDFADEIDGYLRNEDLVKVLNSLTLSKNIYEDLFLCYSALVENEFFPTEELDLLESWVADCKKLEDIN